jgi:outer membrane lipoprotein-sorting protein
MQPQRHRGTEKFFSFYSVLLCHCGCFVLFLFTQAAFADALKPDSSIDNALDMLHEDGVGLKDFTANVKLTEEDAAAGDSTSRTGVVYYQKQSDGNARIHVLFDTQTSGGATSQQKIEYLLADGWLTDRDYSRKTEIVRQVLKPGEKVDLLKLGEGPFPLPIGQAKEDVYKQFDVTKPPAAKDDLANSLHLQLKPKTGTQFADKFSSIDVYVDLKSGFPARIVTVDDNQTIIRTTDLDVKSRNAAIDDKQFSLPTIGSDWNRQTEPFQQ